VEGITLGSNEGVPDDCAVVSRSTEDARALLGATDRRGLGVHLIGVGGCGMTGLAALLAQSGAVVTGSDQVAFKGMGSLSGQGVRVAIGHRADLIAPGTQIVVYSAAVPAHNPEFRAAVGQGIPCLKYAEALGAVMEPRQGVAIAGTHGKSTTAALGAFLFREAGLEPSFVFGATSEQLGGNGGHGDGPHLVVEACEYDRSFLQFKPQYATILNIEPDHFDCFPRWEDLLEAFGDFAAQVQPEGVLVANLDDPTYPAMAERTQARVATFSLSDATADWFATNLEDAQGRFAFDVVHRGERVMSTRLSLPGRYNVSNALAAIALACEAGASPERVAEAVPRFAGIGRRLTWLGQGRGVTILDDYAHHPTEVRLTIAAAQARYAPRRTVVVFQPHQHSRTEHLLDAFAESFEAADKVIVPEVYGAREMDGAPARVGSAELVERLQLRGMSAVGVTSLRAALNLLDPADSVEQSARGTRFALLPGDLVLTMGAGDVWKVADELVARLCPAD
jgi:UDP-N-acetylmuramate--alanine ligase